MSNARWIKSIHVARNKTGIDDAAYRGILSGVGCASSTEIETAEQFNQVMDSFKALGFQFTGLSKKQKSGAAGLPGYITIRQEYYIRGLWVLASREKDERSLRAIIKRIGGVDDISFLPKSSATNVILALRDICRKAGYDPDRRENAKATGEA